MTADKYKKTNTVKGQLVLTAKSVNSAPVNNLIDDVYLVEYFVEGVQQSDTWLIAK